MIGNVDRMTVTSEETVDTINRVNYSKKNFKGVRPFNTSKNKGKQFCPDCHLLSKKLALDINFKHNPADCPRPKGAVYILLEHQDPNLSGPDDDCDYTGKIDQIRYPNNIDPNQMKCDAASLETGATSSLLSENILYCPSQELNEINAIDLHNKVFFLEINRHQIRKEYSPQLHT